MVNVVPRAGWGAAPSKGSGTVPLSARKAIMAHHSEGPAQDGAATIRGIQRYHQNSNGWADIGYNFLITPDGTVYEGRGRDVLGAHCTGQNTAAIGVCFVGSYSNSLPTKAALDAFKGLCADLNAQAGRTLQPIAGYIGHRDKFATSCPGNALYNWLTTGSGTPSSAPTPAPPTPKPAPTPGVPAPAFPLPAGSYFGPKDGGRQSISGYYSHRADLNAWQQRMYDRGWKMLVDGLYGPETDRVARAFQVEKGLSVDGLIGPATWAAAWTAPVTP